GTFARPRIVAVPQEIANPTTNAYGGESILRILIVNESPDALVAKKFRSKLTKPTPACHPSRRNDHAKKFRLQSHRLLNEHLIDGGIVSSAAATGRLIRWIPNNNIESHVGSEQLANTSPYIVSVNECIGVAL